MRQQLMLFRSLWGVVGGPTTRGRPIASAADVAQGGVPGAVLDRLRALHYAGIESSLADLGGSPAARRATVRRLADRGMGLVCGVYASWADYDGAWAGLHADPAAQLRALEGQLTELAHAVRGREATLVHVNAHSGSDAWTDDTASGFYADAAGLASLVPRCRRRESEATAGPDGGHGDGIDIDEGLRPAGLSHETHRARLLGNFFAAARVCEAVGSLRLTLDYSHWVVSAERLVGVGAGAPPAESRLLDALLDRVDHVHARVGSPQSPQVPAKGGPRGWDACRKAHRAVWRRVWAAQARRGARWATTATAEYGPPPDYTPTALDGSTPLYDDWAHAELAAEQLRRWHAEAAGGG